MNKLLVPIVRWLDSYAFQKGGVSPEEAEKIDIVRIIPFILLHVAALLVFVVGISKPAVTVALALYLVRMFAITGFYHRYFSHRSFKTNRMVQFIFAVIGNSSAQRGPLWWAAHHRKHHQHSDTEEDVHSPKQKGFWVSHMLWFLKRGNFPSDLSKVGGFAKFPELIWLDRFDSVVIPALFAVLYWLGETIDGTNGFQLLVWGGIISTLAVQHATFTINSLSHVFGHQRYRTGDDSRNNFLLALLTLGEGWHNNHHHYPLSCRQGIRWWEIDITYYLLRMMSWIGLVRDIHPVPNRIKSRDLLKNTTPLPPVGAKKS